MSFAKIKTLKEVMDVNAANQALGEGWQLVAVVPRGSLLCYVLGKEGEPSGLGSSIAEAVRRAQGRVIEPKD